MILYAFHRRCHPESGIRPTRHLARLFFPIEIRAHDRAFLAAGLTGEPVLEIRQAHMIRPSISADRRRMVHL